MSIQYYGMSLQGFSHIERGVPCQDSNSIKKLNNGWIVAAIADGVGSAAHSEIGSKIAVETSINFIEKYIQNDEWDENVLESVITLAFNEVLKRVNEQSKTDKYDIEDYDTTLSLVIYNGKYVVYGHCGDGGIIVLPKYGDYILLSTIQKGEEFNEVYTLRNKEWNFGHTNEEVVSVLLATDGVFDALFCSPKKNEEGERTIINYNCDLFMNNKRLNPPIIDETTANKTQEECIKFFNGDKLKKITDDKTLVVIINTESYSEDKVYDKPDFSKEKNEKEQWLKAQEENNYKILKEQNINKEIQEKEQKIEEQKAIINHLEDRNRLKEEELKEKKKIIKQLENELENGIVKRQELKAQKNIINQLKDELEIVKREGIFEDEIKKREEILKNEIGKQEEERQKNIIRQLENEISKREEILEEQENVIRHLKGENSEKEIRLEEQKNIINHLEDENRYNEEKLEEQKNIIRQLENENKNVKTNIKKTENKTMIFFYILIMIGVLIMLLFILREIKTNSKIISNTFSKPQPMKIIQQTESIQPTESIQQTESEKTIESAQSKSKQQTESAQPESMKQTESVIDRE